MVLIIFYSYLWAIFCQPKNTTLVIAHRLSTIIDSDKIIVLSDGMIAEEGTHSYLLKSKGLYAEMWMRQQEGINWFSVKLKEIVLLGIYLPYYYLDHALF